MRREIIISVPGSKSITQRALVVASLAAGRSVLKKPCLCDDSLLLQKALSSMGARITMGEDEWDVRSSGRPQPPPAELRLGNAGTAVRFLGALAAILDGRMALDGNEAMRRRPQGELFRPLRALGVKVRCLKARERLPALLSGPADSAAASLKMRARVSSQPVSGLLMAAPLFPRGLRIEVDGGSVSLPYIRMTAAVMEHFGVHVRQVNERLYAVPAQSYRPAVFEIEGDASSAAVLLAAGHITARKVVIQNVAARSIQGDAVFPGILEQLSSGGDVALDMEETPDIVPPAVAVSLFRTGATTLRRISHLQAKESDRLAVLVRELGKLGADIRQDRGTLTVVPSRLKGGVRLDPHGDHRMAMTFALVGLRLPRIQILDRGCVSKSFPGFFEVLERFQ